MITILISSFKSRTSQAGAVILVALLTAACGGTGAASDSLTIVATTSIWGDVVTQIVAGDAEVEVLIPRGADSHGYQPSSQQAAVLATADLVVANGLGLEEGLHDLLEGAAGDGVNILEVAPALDPIPFTGDGHGDESHEDEEHGHGDLDPHVWFDPQRVADAAALIAAELAALDSSVDWEERARSYGDELMGVDSEMEALLGAVAADARKLVTNHDSLGYLADRFDFEIVGVVIPGGSTLGEPSSAELADLVATIEEENVAAIFTETTDSSALAEAVAAEIGRDIDVVELFTGSLGELGGPAATLSNMLVEDARRIADALSE